MSVSANRLEKRCRAGEYSPVRTVFLSKSDLLLA